MDASAKWKVLLRRPDGSFAGSNARTVENPSFSARSQLKIVGVNFTGQSRKNPRRSADEASAWPAICKLPVKHLEMPRDSARLLDALKKISQSINRRV
jgi:hypothetical protein